MDDEERARFFREVFNLSRERLRQLFRLEEAWQEYCSRVEQALAMVAAGRRESDLDSDEQWLVQREAVARETFLQAMGAPHRAIAIARRLLAAMEHRRNRRPDSLFAIPEGGGNYPPASPELRVRSFVVRAAIQLRKVKRYRSLDAAYRCLAETLAWIATDSYWKGILDGTPTAEAIRGWYDERNTDSRFGRYFALIDLDLPSDLSDDDLADWLVKAVSSANGSAFQGNGTD